jgi:hypothetical protein
MKGRSTELAARGMCPDPQRGRSKAMSAPIINLIIELIAGAIGGNAAWAARS